MPQGNFAAYTPQEQIAAARALLQQRGLPMNTDNLNRAMQSLYTGGEMGTSGTQAAVDQSIARTERAPAQQQPLPLPPPSPPEQPNVNRGGSGTEVSNQPAPTGQEAQMMPAIPAETGEGGGSVSDFFRNLYQQQAPQSWGDLLPFLLAPPAMRAAGMAAGPLLRMAPRALPAPNAAATGRMSGGAATPALPAPTPQLPGPTGAAAQAATPDASMMQRFMRLFSTEQPASPRAVVGGRRTGADPAAQSRAGRLYGDEATQPQAPRRPRNPRRND